MKLPNLKIDKLKIKRSHLAVVLVFALVFSLFAGLLIFRQAPSASAAWYTPPAGGQGTWNYRQKITIDHTKVSNTNQTDFPVLIKIADENNAIFAKTQADGDDILFTGSDEVTKLSHEIEEFSTSSNSMIAWVKISTLSASIDTVIYLYYGNAAATNQENIADVWSNGYAGVWHMNDNAANANVADSTGVNNGTAQQNTSVLTTSGKEGGALSFNGAGDYVNVLSSASLNFGTGDFSVSGWVKLSVLTTDWHILTKGSLSAPYPGYLLGNKNSGDNHLRFGARSDYRQSDGNVYSTTVASTGTWYYVNGVRSGTNIILYVNGIGENTASSSNYDVSTDAPLVIGMNNGNTRYLNGLIDEVHASSAARSADWIATEYANQNSPETFFLLESEAKRDSVAPANPTVNGYSTDGKIVSLISGNYYNYPTPYFEWISSVDTSEIGDPSGVAGYYSYFGTSCGDGGGNPYQTRGVLSDTGGGLHYSADTNITVPNLGATEGTYCLRIKTADLAGNISAVSELFTYKFDVSNPSPPSYIAVNPAGYSSVNSFAFSWPVALDTINAYSSGIAGYQYKRGGDSGDDWSATIADPSVSGIASYKEGENIFFLRAVDGAGNYSSEIQTTYYYSSSLPAKPTGLTATPELSDVNSFAFSWTAPSHTRPIASYGYSVNAEPTDQNITWTGTAATSLSADSFATKQGVNTLYLLAKDDAGSYSLTADNYTTVNFNCMTAAPPIPSTISITDSSDRTLERYMLTLQWQAGTGHNANTFKNYVIERSVDNSTFTELSTSASTAYIDTDLSNEITYFYRIKAVDNAGATSASSATVSKMPTGKFITPPVMLSEPQVSTKSTTATIAWVVSRDSTASVRFGKNKDALDSGQLSTTLETDHSILLVGLDPGETYYYQVQSLDQYRDYSLDDAYSTTYSFATLDSPSIANVTVSNITLTSADITWETTTASNTKVHYGNSISYGLVLPEADDSMTTKHSVKLSNLAHTTKYHFKIQGGDIDDNTMSSDDYVFDTLPMPTISTIEYQPDFSGPAPTVNITWLTNVPTTSSVEYTPIASADNVTFEQSQSAFVVRHSVFLSNLSNDTEYKFTVSGVDQFGNKTLSDLQILRTSSDSRSPVISDVVIESSNVGSGNNNEARVIISWKTDELSTSQIAYDEGLAGSEYRKKTPPDMAMTKNHVVIISGLNPGAPYHFKIVSADQTGNIAFSADQTVITGQVTESVFAILTRTLNNIFGWLGRI
ncbi:MAG: DUF2341 domain-containing protein [Patescibacteria group bacterium]